MMSRSTSLSFLLLVAGCCGTAIICGRAQTLTDCVANLGARDPPAVCSQSQPCTQLLSTYAAQGITQLSEPESPPAFCRALYSGTLYNDGAPLSVEVPGSPTGVGVPTTRHYCKYVPPTASAQAKVPLVVFFHGSGGSATVIYREGWRAAAQNGVSGVFGGQPFAVISTQALNRRWPPSGALGPEDGTKHDILFRNISTNDDIRYTDTLIDTVIANANGAIDASRIYVTGYSNGAYFAAMYGGVRSGSTDGGSWGAVAGRTPAGHVIAAAAVFSGASPWSRTTNCKYTPIPTTTLPYLAMLYLCDLVSCVEANEFAVEAAAAGSRRTEVVLLDDQGSVIANSNTGNGANPACSANPPGCTYSTRLANHQNYPTGQISVLLTFMARFQSSTSPSGGPVVSSSTTAAAARGGTATPTNTPKAGSATLQPSPSTAAAIAGAGRMLLSIIVPLLLAVVAMSGAAPAL